VKYAFMLAHVADFSVSGMCRVFEVSRSGFYDWQASHEQRKQRAAKQAALDAAVKKAFFHFKMRYSYSFFNTHQTKNSCIRRLNSPYTVEH
jgi:hypothetical protein